MANPKKTSSNQTPAQERDGSADEVTEQSNAPDSADTSAAANNGAPAGGEENAVEEAGDGEKAVAEGDENKDANPEEVSGGGKKGKGKRKQKSKKKAKGGEGDGDDENKPKGHKGPYKMTWNAESDRKILLVMATDPKKCKGEEFKAKFAETLREKPSAKAIAVKMSKLRTEGVEMLKRIESGEASQAGTADAPADDATFGINLGDMVFQHMSVAWSDLPPRLVKAIKEVCEHRAQQMDVEATLGELTDMHRRNYVEQLEQEEAAQALLRIAAGGDYEEDEEGSEEESEADDYEEETETAEEQARTAAEDLVKQLTGTQDKKN